MECGAFLIEYRALLIENRGFEKEYRALFGTGFF